MRTDLPATPIGHNSGNLTVTVEARLFNSLARFGPEDGSFQTVDFQVGATVKDLIQKLNVPVNEIFLVLRNGRDISSGTIGAPLNVEAVLDDGDVIAFSGPVPYSFGYGAPVV